MNLKERIIISLICILWKQKFNDRSLKIKVRNLKQVQDYYNEIVDCLSGTYQ